MAAEEIDDFISLAPPPKRIRLDSAVETQCSTTMDAVDDIYRRANNKLADTSALQAVPENDTAIENSSLELSCIPGLGRIGNPPRPAAKVTEPSTKPEAFHDRPNVFSDLNCQLQTVAVDDEVYKVDAEKLGTQPSEAQLPSSNSISAELDCMINDTRIAKANQESTNALAGPIIANSVDSQADYDMLEPSSNATAQNQLDSMFAGSGSTDLSRSNDQMVADISKAPVNGISLAPSVGVTETGLEGEQLNQAHISSAPTTAGGANQAECVPMQADDIGEVSSLPLTHALEALLGGLDQQPGIPVGPEAPEGNHIAEEAAAEEEHPEWEADSSPIESSSDVSTSEDSSSEDSDEDDSAYKLLSPEEQARILMEGDGGSDDESGIKGAKGSGGQLRTKNEVPEEIIPKPDVTITPEMAIEELGTVEAIVESILLIKAKTSGEYRVLESSSVLCLADRSVIGSVSETLGRVQQPLYSVRFTNAEEIAEAGLAVGTKVFYSEKHSTYVFTEALKAYKGSDASNLHDEEVGDEEIEFSDDDAEMEHKRKLKQKKMDRRGGKLQHSGGQAKGGHPLQQQHKFHEAGVALSYNDDFDDEGPYKPLARPIGFAHATVHSEAPQEVIHPRGNDRTKYSGHGSGKMNYQSRESFLRGRGNRGRGSDRGRGNHQDRRIENSGYSQTPEGGLDGGFAHPLQSPAGTFQQQPSQSLRNGEYSHIRQGPQTVPPNNHYMPPQDQYSPHQPQIWPQYTPPQPYQHQSYQQPYQNMQNGLQNINPAAPPPTGAFINPAFFAGNHPGGFNQWGQQGPQAGRGNGL